MIRTASIAVVLLTFVSCTAARADLVFDLRAVSGSQVTIHGRKSVAVNQNSVGGWIDFELWALITGMNASPHDEGLQHFVGSILSPQIGNGAARGSMNNSGEIAPGVGRGIVSPFDGTGYYNGTLTNLDDDPDMEIGSLDHSSSTTGFLRGRVSLGFGEFYDGDGDIAELPLFRFTLPIESMSAQTLQDMTLIMFALHTNRISYLWFEDGTAKNAVVGIVEVSGVSIHTVPEPGTWLLALVGMVGAGWFAKRRRH